MKNAKFEVWINGIFGWEFDNYQEAYERLQFSYEVTKKPCKLVTVWK